MTSVSTQLFLILTSLLLVLPVVEAVEAGDAIALLLGVVLSITGICACLGVYARKRNGQMWLRRASWIKPFLENLCAVEVKSLALVLKVPKKQWIRYFHILGCFPTNRNKLIYIKWGKEIFFPRKQIMHWKMQSVIYIFQLEKGSQT